MQTATQMRMRVFKKRMGPYGNSSGYLALCSRYDLVRYASLAMINSLSAFNKTIYLVTRVADNILNAVLVFPIFFNHMHVSSLDF